MIIKEKKGKRVASTTPFIYHLYHGNIVPKKKTIDNVKYVHIVYHT